MTLLAIAAIYAAVLVGGIFLARWIDQRRQRNRGSDW